MKLQTCAPVRTQKHYFVHLAKFSFVLLTVSLGVVGQMRAADQYWRTDGTTGGTWTSNYWNIGLANATGGTGWTAGNNAVFTAASTLTFATATVGNVTVSASQNVTVTAGGTLTLAGVRTFNIGGGATLNWVSQPQSTSLGNEGAGIFLTGGGTLNWGSGPGSSDSRFDGGFTLDSGTVIVSGKYAFGVGTMTINGGATQQNLDAWTVQVASPDGSKVVPEIKTHMAGAFKITQITLFGTFQQTVPAPGIPPLAKENYGLLGGAVESPQGTIYWRVTGPTETIRALEPVFAKILDSVKPEVAPKP